MLPVFLLVIASCFCSSYPLTVHGIPDGVHLLCDTSWQLLWTRGTTGPSVNGGSPLEFPEITGTLRIIEWSGDDEDDAVVSPLFHPTTLTFTKGVASGSISLPKVCGYSALQFRLEVILDKVEATDDDHVGATTLVSGKFSFVDSFVWTYPSPGQPLVSALATYQNLHVDFLQRVSNNLALFRSLNLMVLGDDVPGSRGLITTPWGVASVMGALVPFAEETILSEGGSSYIASSLPTTEVELVGPIIVSRSGFFNGRIGTEVPVLFHMFALPANALCDDVTLASFFSLQVYGADNAVVGDRLRLGWDPMPFCQVSATGTPLHMHPITFVSTGSSHLSIYSTYGYVDDLLAEDDIRREVEPPPAVTQLAHNDPGVIVVSFRGTAESLDWETNADVRRYDCVDIDMPCDMGKVHRGFMDELLSAMPVLNDVFLRLVTSRRGNPASIIFTGHSQGGSIAAIAAALLTARWNLDNVRLITFGQPRSGNGDFRDFLEAQLGLENILRVDANNDLVPTVPAGFTWRHAGVRMETPCDSWNPVSCHSMVLYTTHALSEARPDEFRESHLLEHVGATLLAGSRASVADEKGLEASLPLILGVSVGAICCVVLCLTLLGMVLVVRRRRTEQAKHVSLPPTSGIHMQRHANGMSNQPPNKSRRASVSLGHRTSRRPSQRNIVKDGRTM